MNSDLAAGDRAATIAGAPAPQWLTPAAIAAGLAFCLLAVMNVGGYRYGASDQAFYIPAIAARMDPALFPRDRPLLEAEGRLMLFDDALAAIASRTGWTLESIFLVSFAVGLAALALALIWNGRVLYRSPWGIAVLLFAMTLRHRIPRTGVNTLEGYLHPRMIAFAAGVFAMAMLLHGRPWTALALVVAAALVHPTTAVWFAILIAVAITVDVPRWRRVMLAAIALGGIAATGLLLGPLRDRLVVMDPRWIAALASKDYLFPAGWPLVDWMVNLAYPLVVFSIFRMRRAGGIAVRGERGLVAGAFVLFGGFLASVPLTMIPIALAVQMQVSRVFWILDCLATMYVVWLVVEGARPSAVLWWRRAPAGSVSALRPSRRQAMAAALVLGLASAGRGIYVMALQHPDRALVEPGLPRNEWTDVMAHVAKLPPTTHVLADPGHAWKFGTSVRVAAARDVYLEDVKDTAIGMYSRHVAARVAARAFDLREFESMTAERARALARDHDLDVLVIDRDLPLKEIYRNARFRIYSLR
jgi:hypothetical protein